MFGYEVNSNEYEQKQNFGQTEHRNEDEVMYPDNCLVTIRNVLVFITNIYYIYNDDELKIIINNDFFSCESSMNFVFL